MFVKENQHRKKKKKKNYRVVKIRDMKKLQQDIENDPIIKDQMANLGCFLYYVHTYVIYGDWLGFVGFMSIR